MAGNNLLVRDTGLDHCFINGIPIVEAEIEISDVLKKIARITSLAVQADPYFNDKTNAQKLFSESHGEGDRITMDFLEEGCRDMLSMFIPFQRLIPEGTYDSTPIEYETKSQKGNFSWSNPDPSSIFVNSIEVRCTDGNGDITFVVDSNELGTITLPDFTLDQTNYLNFTERQNLRNNNIAQTIECIISNATNDFTYDVKINAVKYDAIGWIKALTEVGDVHLPSYKDDIKISHLIKDFAWINSNMVKVNGAVVKCNSGSSYVTIIQNGIEGVEKFIDNNTIGDDYFGISEDIATISIRLREPSSDFNYDLIINSELSKIIPSPRFEFNSNWNVGKIIFRYQNMDTRLSKLNYTSETLKDIRIDPNVFDEVLNYLTNSLKNYVLKELYLAIGYDKKAVYYQREYKNSRTDAKFWLRSEKGLQTQYHHAGV